MARRIVGCITALAAVVPFVGCLGFGAGTTLNGINNVPVETPKVSAASVQAAERVEQVGRDLLVCTPIGLPDISFQCIGSDEPELFHRDAHGIFITEGLVKLCKTDDQLAAVLATEIGKMTAEFRRGAGQRNPQPIPATSLSGKYGDSTDMDPGRAMELAQFDKAGRKPSDTTTLAPTDPKGITAEVLRNARYAETALAEASGPLKEAEKHAKIGAQFSGRGGAPRWSD